MRIVHLFILPSPSAQNMCFSWVGHFTCASASLPTSRPQKRNKHNRHVFIQRKHASGGICNTRLPFLLPEHTSAVRAARGRGRGIVGDRRGRLRGKGKQICQPKIDITKLMGSISSSGSAYKRFRGVGNQSRVMLHGGWWKFWRLAVFIGCSNSLNFYEGQCAFETTSECKSRHQSCSRDCIHLLFLLAGFDEFAALFQHVSIQDLMALSMID